MHFVSPTHGQLSLEEVFRHIDDFIHESPSDSYKIIIGTDSMKKKDTVFVSAIVIHRQGKGAKYFFSKSRHKYIASLRQKIFHETSLSLEISQHFKNYILLSGLSEKVKLEIHVDIGNNGETRKLIKEIVGMVTGSGLTAKIKPDSFVASTVADRHTR